MRELRVLAALSVGRSLGAKRPGSLFYISGKGEARKCVEADTRLVTRLLAAAGEAGVRRAKPFETLRFRTGTRTAKKISCIRLAFESNRNNQITVLCCGSHPTPVIQYSSDAVNSKAQPVSLANLPLQGLSRAVRALS